MKSINLHCKKVSKKTTDTKIGILEIGNSNLEPISFNEYTICSKMEVSKLITYKYNKPKWLKSRKSRAVWS